MITVSELSNPSKCIPFLEHQQQRIYAPNLKVAASMVMKRYAQDYSVHMLNMMLFEKQDAFIPMTACTITEELNLEIDVTQVLYTENRATIWSGMFADHLTEVAHSLHQATNLPYIILWDNVAVRLNSFFRKAITNHPCSSEDIRALAEELRALDGTAFGWSKHPVLEALVPVDDLTAHKTRKTCCYYNKLDKEKEMPECLVCPLK